MPPRWRRRKLAAEFEFAQWAEVAWRWVSQREVAGPRDGDARYATEPDIDAALVDIIGKRGAAAPSLPRRGIVAFKPASGGFDVRRDGDMPLSLILMPRWLI